MASWTRILIMFLAASLAGCGAGDSGDSLQAATNRAWSVGTDLVDVEWDSGKTNDLSAWKLLTCYSTYGSDYLLTGLHTFEDSGSADSFIAKLGGQCSGYSESGGTWVQDGRHETDVIFTADHKTTGEWTKLDADEYAMGIEFETELLGSNYVQTIRFLTVSETNPGLLGSYASPGTTPWAGPGGSGFLIGNIETLECGDQYVIAALSLQYDVTNGKIRTLRIGCRPLTDN